MLIQNTASTLVSTPSWSAGSSGSPPPAAQTQRIETGQPAMPQAAQQSAPAPSQERLSDEINKINTVLQRNNKDLELSIGTDESTRKQIVKLTDKETGEVVIQYPSDAVLAIAQAIDEFQQGMLLKRQA